MRPPSAMNNLAYSPSNNFIPGFSGRLQGCLIGLDNNPIRSHHQNGTLNSVEELLPCPGVTRFLGDYSSQGWRRPWQNDLYPSFFHIQNAATKGSIECKVYKKGLNITFAGFAQRLFSLGSNLQSRNTP